MYLRNDQVNPGHLKLPLLRVPSYFSREMYLIKMSTSKFCSKKILTGSL